MCSVCNGYPNCPVCSSEPYMATCPECNGDGYIYYNEEGRIVSKEQYNNLHPHDRYDEPCECCDGTGEIEYELDYEYSDYD
ncbi:MAG: hypothetical protein ACK5M3_01125 [Dysgonomonas sp.]